MFRFEDRQKKEYVECLGPGPHVTKNGSRWLVVGLHPYTEIQDGTVRCKSCAERTKTWLPRAAATKPIGHWYLSEEDRTQLRTGLAELRKTAKIMEDRALVKLISEKEDNARRTEPTTRQGKL